MLYVWTLNLTTPDAVTLEAKTLDALTPWHINARRLDIRRYDARYRNTCRFDSRWSTLNLSSKDLSE